jgi:hypothetical protein
MLYLLRIVLCVFVFTAAAHQFTVVMSDHLLKPSNPMLECGRQIISAARLERRYHFRRNLYELPASHIECAGCFLERLAGAWHIGLLLEPRSAKSSELQLNSPVARFDFAVEHPANRRLMEADPAADIFQRASVSV